MAQFEFKLPDIGEGVVEGEIVKWLVKAGDEVSEDQPLVEVMTDKATVTIPSPRQGKVLKVVGICFRSPPMSFIENEWTAWATDPAPRNSSALNQAWVQIWKTLAV